MKAADIKAEQVDLLYQHASMVLAGAALMGITLVLVFWGKVPPLYTTTWLCVLLTATLLRLLMVGRYKKSGDAPGKAVTGGRRFTYTTFISGVIWGAGYALFFRPEYPLYVLFSACMYVGMITAATLSLSAYMPSYLAFVLPTTLPVSLRTFLEGGDIYQVLGLSYLLFLGVGIFFSNNLNRMVARSIRLRFENLELLEDLKEQKNRAEKNRQTAEQAVLAKDRFLASASHDLRQPLHALGLFYGALKQYISDREGLHLLDKIDQSIGALNHIFNSLLDVSRLDAGVVGIEKRHFELAPLLGTIYSEYHQAADNKGVRLECRACDAVVFTDPVLLERILRNLVSNAISYTQAGDVQFGCVAQQDGSIRIEVLDTGIGIPVEALEDIFSEYHQIDNPERDRSKGLGLGLAIVRRLARLLDVQVSVQSEPGKGSRFSVIVPPGDPAQVVEYDRKGTLQDVSGTVVLVIDDDSDIRDGMQRLLSEWGCMPVLAGSAEEAIVQLVGRDIVPDVIFVDYRLRENRTGIDALHAVSEELNVDLPAVIITGDTSRDRLQEATEHGLALLHKPVSPAEVRVAIHQALARR